jgi:hypothetical protein
MEVVAVTGRRHQNPWAQCATGRPLKERMTFHDLYKPGRARDFSTKTESANPTLSIRRLRRMTILEVSGRAMP